MWFWALIQTGLLILIVRGINKYFNRQVKRYSYCKESKFLQQFKLTKISSFENWATLDKIHIRHFHVKETVSIVGGNVQKTLTARGYIRQLNDSSEGDTIGKLQVAVIYLMYSEGASIDPDFCGIVTKSKSFRDDRENFEAFFDLSKEAYEEISRLLSSNSLTASLETRYDLVNKWAKDDKAAPTAFRIMSIGELTPEVTDTFLGYDFNDDSTEIHL